MVRLQFIDYDLESRPLQIQTDSVIGSEEYLTLVMYTEENDDIYSFKDLGYFYISFGNPITITVPSCSSNSKSFLTPLPLEPQKIWTVTKSSTNLIIHCNEVKVFEFRIGADGPECGSKWSKDVAKIVFWGIDTASDRYRSNSLTCDSLPDVPHLEMASGTLPVNQFTEVTVKCGVGFRLDGDDVITCDQGNNFIGSSTCLTSKGRHDLIN